MPTAAEHATHVQIGEIVYRLGQTSRGGTQIQCIAADGLVHRVCTYLPQGVAPGTVLLCHGERLRFFRP